MSSFRKTTLPTTRVVCEYNDNVTFVLVHYSHGCYGFYREVLGHKFDNTRRMTLKEWNGLMERNIAETKW